jgi:hypothetical protein
VSTFKADDKVRCLDNEYADDSSTRPVNRAYRIAEVRSDGKVRIRGNASRRDLRKPERFEKKPTGDEHVQGRRCAVPQAPQWRYRSHFIGEAHIRSSKLIRCSFMFVVMFGVGIRSI